MRVGLCTPCYQGTVHHQHMLSVVETLRLAFKLSVEIHHLTAPGCPVLPRVRNRLVATALSADCDWIVFADDDIAWSAPDLFKLIEHDVDVVGAAPPKRHARWDEAPAVAAKFAGMPLIGQHTNVGRLWKADGVASAFVAIRADVFRKMEAVTTAHTYQGDVPSRYQMRDWFSYSLVTRDGLTIDDGEDYTFCRKWNDLGGSCWIDPDIRVRHYDGNVCHDFCLSDVNIHESEQEAA